MVTIRRIFLSLVLLLVAIPIARLMASRDTSWSEVAVHQVVPGVAKPGDEVLILGNALDSGHVLEVHLLDGHNDYRAAIVQQCETAIRIRVPAKISAGDMRIGVKIPHYNTPVEQPAYLKILDLVG
jgi:hypothetical protein